MRRISAQKCIPLIVSACLPLSGWGESQEQTSASWSDLVPAMEAAAAVADTGRLEELLARLKKSEPGSSPWREYWIAFSEYRLGLFSKEKSEANAAYKRCTKTAAEAIERGELSGESEALRGACFSQLAGGGPMAGMRYGSCSAVAIETALGDAPDSPRALLIAGARDLYTPTQFGGDIDRAVQRLERAIERFAQERTTGRQAAWQPQWGVVDAYGHLATAYRQLERREEARRVLDQASATGISSPWLDSIRKDLDA